MPHLAVRWVPQWSSAVSCGSTTCTAEGWCRPTTQAISQYFDVNAEWAATASGTMSGRSAAPA